MSVEQVAKLYGITRGGVGTATGIAREMTYEGTWAEMVAMADARAAVADGMGLSITVNRMPGGFAECKIREDEFDGVATDDKPGSTRENPQYSLSVAAVPEPILTHPNCDGYSDDVMAALKCIVNGGNKKSTISIKGANGARKDVYVEDVIDMENVDNALLAKILKGVTSYYSPQIQLQARYKVQNPAMVQYMDACTIKTPPGPFPTPEGRDWLFMGSGIEGGGDDWSVTETYLLSGIDGWDQQIYGNS